MSDAGSNTQNGIGNGVMSGPGQASQPGLPAFLATGPNRYAWAMTLNVFLFLLLGLTVVWLRVERTHSSVAIRQVQEKLAKTKSQAAKLEVERNHLASPERLKEKAREFGLSEAASGQIRRLPCPQCGPGI